MTYSIFGAICAVVGFRFYLLPLLWPASFRAFPWSDRFGANGAQQLAGGLVRVVAAIGLFLILYRAASAFTDLLTPKTWEVAAEYANGYSPEALFRAALALSGTVFINANSERTFDRALKQRIDSALWHSMVGAIFDGRTISLEDARANVSAHVERIASTDFNDEQAFNPKPYQLALRQRVEDRKNYALQRRDSA